MTAKRLSDFKTLQATITAVVIEAKVIQIDQIIEMHDRIIDSFLIK